MCIRDRPIGKLLGERNGDNEDGLPREEYLSLLVTAIVLDVYKRQGIMSATGKSCILAMRQPVAMSRKPPQALKSPIIVGVVSG